MNTKLMNELGINMIKTLSDAIEQKTMLKPAKDFMVFLKEGGKKDNVWKAEHTIDLKESMMYEIISKLQNEIEKYFGVEKSPDIMETNEAIEIYENAMQTIIEAATTELIKTKDEPAFLKVINNLYFSISYRTIIEVLHFINRKEDENINKVEVNIEDDDLPF